ncbi:MAG: hypothetical protein LQ344_002903 [Seirophora lacunosa]|nr:MAG: hypothetical protein LQ344_002903 [Seirophora lacunosa]
MDPLSIAASVIAVAGLAASTSRAFQELRSLCKTLPGRLHALSNEVADFELVLHQVGIAFEERSTDPLFKDHASSIPKVLQGADRKLEELRAIVQKFSRSCRGSRAPFIGALTWRKDLPKLQALQEDIRTIKCNLNILLGASNSQDMKRIRLDINALSSITLEAARTPATLQDTLQEDLARHHHQFENALTRVYAQVDERIGAVQALLEAQSAQLAVNQTNQLGDIYGPRYRQRPRRPAKRITQHPHADGNPSIAVRVNQYSPCHSGCQCICHVESKSSTPSIVDRVLGQVFVGYSGLPCLNSKCDLDTCEKSQSPNMSFEYWFPMGFVWSQIVRFRWTYERNLGPHFEISTLRRVPDSAQCVAFALNGDTEGLKDLFRRGLASPRDWAMYGKQYQTCKFLVHAGADLDYRPIAVSDNSPRNKAHQFLLMGGLSDDDVEALRCLTQDSDFVDEQNYTLLHRIVLGLSMQELEEALCLHPDLIDVPDAMGRTALAWASARGDERSIVTLLQHGAEVNTIDVQYSGVVGHAADRNYVTCVRLLLEAGADPDIAASQGHKVGNPLNVAARNASDPLILKTLLDFGADVESSGVDGTTALIHATRKDNANFATVLLEYGANINAVSTAGQTPLTTAVIFNSHNVLQLLLDRWFEYSECPRLKGPHLLQITALYADARTMAILMRTHHLVISHDANFTVGDFASRLHERPDATEKLIDAFEDLLSVISKAGSELCRSPESMMESGLASPDRWTFHTSDTLSSDQDFMDAFESLHCGGQEGKGEDSRPESSTGRGAAVMCG